MASGPGEAVAAFDATGQDSDPQRDGRRELRYVVAALVLAPGTSNVSNPPLHRRRPRSVGIHSLTMSEYHFDVDKHHVTHLQVEIRPTQQLYV